MIDPVKLQDSVVVAVVMTEKEDKYVGIHIARVMCARLR